MNYADDTTPYIVVLESLFCLTKKKTFSLFANNQMIASNDRFHLILSSPDEDTAIQTRIVQYSNKSQE